MTSIQDPVIERLGPDAQRRSDRRTERWSSLLFLAGTILYPVSALANPVPSPDEEWEIGNAAMLADDAFEPARLLEMCSLVLLVAAFVIIARSATVRRLAAMRTALLVIAAAMAVAVADQVAFMLASNEADELLTGGSTPFFDTHLIVQAAITPIIALSAVALAVLDARQSPRWTWLPALLAVIGGLLAASFGPLLAITRDLSVTVVGAGWSLLIIWMLITAIRRIINVRAGRDVALT